MEKELRNEKLSREMEGLKEQWPTVSYTGVCLSFCHVLGEHFG